MVVSSFSSNINGFYVWERTVFPMFDMRESSELRIRVDSDAKAYYRSLSQMANRQAREKEASSKSRLLKVADTPCPLGSVHPKHPLRAKALRELLNQPSSALSDFWRMVSIDQWKLKYGNPTPEHTMTAHSKKIAQARNSSGGKCALCAKTRTNWMIWLGPLRSALQGAFRIMPGESDGVTMCLIWGNER